MSISSSVRHNRPKCFVITSHCCVITSEKRNIVSPLLPSPITQFTNSQINWTPGKNLVFSDLFSEIVSLQDFNGHELAPKEMFKGIRFFNRNGHKAQKMISHICSVDDAKDDFY